jgi:hypothetical protein
MEFGDVGIFIAGIMAYVCQPLAASHARARAITKDVKSTIRATRVKSGSFFRKTEDHAIMLKKHANYVRLQRFDP